MNTEENFYDKIIISQDYPLIASFNIMFSIFLSFRSIIQKIKILKYENK